MPTMTAAQRRDRDRRADLAAFADCDASLVLERLGDKWSARLLTTLRDGGLRHAELARRVPGVTQKVLTQTLRLLERDGLVARSVEAAVPPLVSYRLTTLGVDLLPALDAVTGWASGHAERIRAARREYDSRGS